MKGVVMRAAAANTQTRLVTGRVAGCASARTNAMRRNCGATASVFTSGEFNSLETSALSLSIDRSRTAAKCRGGGTEERRGKRPPICRATDASFARREKTRVLPSGFVPARHSAFTSRARRAKEREREATMTSARPVALSFLLTDSHFSSRAGAGLSCARRVVGAQTKSRGGALIVEANAKRCLGSTTGGTNRHRKRTSGFRIRKRSATGSKVLKNRRKKGRKQIAPASKHSGKK